MNLLLINPNTSQSVSDLIEAEARRAAAPGTQVTVLTAPFGVAYIETRFEALVGAYAAAQVAAEHHASYDAVVVAAFGDPGLTGLRELLPVPVTGMTEAALATAHLLGHRISIIAISQRIQAWYREVVEANGLIGRLASIRALDRPLASIGAVQDDHAAALRELCERAVREDGAEVIILAGAPLAGLARTLRGQLPVPVVDGVSSAVRMPSRWSRSRRARRCSAASRHRRSSRTMACRTRSPGCSAGLEVRSGRVSATAEQRATPGRELQRQVDVLRNVAHLKAERQHVEERARVGAAVRAQIGADMEQRFVAARFYAVALHARVVELAVRTQRSFGYQPPRRRQRPQLDLHALCRLAACDVDRVQGNSACHVAAPRVGYGTVAIGVPC